MNEWYWKHWNAHISFHSISFQFICQKCFSPKNKYEANQSAGCLLVYETKMIRFGQVKCDDSWWLRSLPEDPIASCSYEFGVRFDPIAKLDIFSRPDFIQYQLLLLLLSSSSFASVCVSSKQKEKNRFCWNSINKSNSNANKIRCTTMISTKAHFAIVSSWMKFNVLYWKSCHFNIEFYLLLPL